MEKKHLFRRIGFWSISTSNKVFFEMMVRAILCQTYLDLDFWRINWRCSRHGVVGRPGAFRHQWRPTLDSSWTETLRTSGMYTRVCHFLHVLRCIVSCRTQTRKGLKQVSWLSLSILSYQIIKFMACCSVNAFYWEFHRFRFLLARWLLWVDSDTFWSELHFLR